jgi:hypothetical protein
MNEKNITNSINPTKTPRGWSGGLQFGAAIPPAAVILVSLIIVFILNLMTDATLPPSPPENVRIAALFTPEIQHWNHKIISWSDKYDLDPNLIATVMQIESCGHPRASSHAGAMGLFQVMPYHFSKEDDPYKPNINARRGLTYLKRSLEAVNGDVRLALAGYNGGITGAKRPESDWPTETIRFAYWGLGIYGDAKQGKTQSERLDEWLGAGGASLCKAAAKNLDLQP